ncbi:CRISPR-associated endonuclease Cas2 [Spirosoma sordidisoli]|uniref:CRISPR-associated endoribonuclease Cas2 n=1 Tax=Spirosoma sordidisoli TaxID=2502893 RepID=A0A4Q2UQF7_9BACT|nr:CRISPR-associated endonuclease Cas2 [Spirosoma sordidisoli]RYC70041.1 CRISPR-associated endonuclease Cas2 [Spirosoma sordidisoli]
MLYLASYDIENDKLRLKVANSLLAAGLERLQRSVFVGTLDDGGQQRLLTEINRYLLDADPAGTQFMLMPLAEAYARKTDWLGHGPPDWTYHCHQALTLII